MSRFEPIFDKDVSKMRGVPGELCNVKVQNKFIDAKRNMISRRIQAMIEHRTLYEWQLPQLKNKVLNERS